MVVTTLLLVVKHSTTLSAVIGLVVVVSLTMDTILLGCDTIEMFCCLRDEQLSIIVEDDFGTIWIKPIQKKLHQNNAQYDYIGKKVPSYCTYMGTYLATYACIR